MMPVARSIFLKTGFAVVLAGISQASFAEILGGSNEVPKSRKEAIISSQARLGTNLIKKLASDEKSDANIVVSPASLASIFSFIDLGSDDAMRRAIHRTLGFRPAAKARANQEIKELRGQVTATIARNMNDGPLNLANLLVFDPSTKPRELMFASTQKSSPFGVDDRPLTLHRHQQGGPGLNRPPDPGVRH